MKKSISYWSFEGGLEGKKNIREAFQEAKAAGFDAVELCLGETGELSLATSESDCKKILADARDAGIEIPSIATGLYWSYSMTDDDPEVRAKAMEITKKCVDVASWLNVNTFLYIPGFIHVAFMPESPVVSYDLVYERALAALKEASKYAESKKVNIAVEEVWNMFLLSPLEMRDFIDEVGSDYVGCYFDVGNVVLFGYPEQWIRILGKRIKRVHLKDFKRSVGTIEGFCDLTEGDVNWTEVMKALREVGYDGYLTAEMIPPRPDLLEKTSKAMDRILSM